MPRKHRRRTAATRRTAASRTAAKRTKPDTSATTSTRAREPGPPPPRRLTTRAKQKAFLEAYAAVGVITAAAKLAGIDRQRHYEWLAKDPRYGATFEDAQEQANDRLETEAVRRAVQGWDEPVYQQGQRVGVVRRYSDRMLELMLKSRRPEKFRERHAVEHTGKNGGPIEHRATTAIDLTKLSDEDLAHLKRMVRQQKTA